jgi:phosphate:Na+ symporter
MKLSYKNIILILAFISVLPFSSYLSAQDSIPLSGTSPASNLQITFPVQSGNHQYQVAGFELPEPVLARVIDSIGNPVEGIRVYMYTSEKPGKAEGFSCQPSSVVSNEDGIATFRVILGSEAGQYQAMARIEGNIKSDTILFSFHARGKNWVILLISGLLGGLALFLWGMKMMSSGMQNSAGDRMRSILGNLTRNRFVAMIMGIFITTAIQSSSATSVMLVGFVNSRLMEFRKTIAIILGALIGTTITAQIIAFKITDYALLMIAIGFIIYVFSSKPRIRYIGETVLGFGILFYGMHLMSESMYPLRTFAPFLDLMVNLENPLLAILVGIVFTALIQSSSAFIGIMIVMASQGLLSLEAAIPLILGANVGTAITAILASLNSSRESLKVGIAMILIKITGVLILVWWIPTFASFIEMISPKSLAATDTQVLAETLPRQIANAHTINSIFLAVLFMPFTNLLARLVDRIIPDATKPDEVELRTMYLDSKFSNTPSLGLNLAKQEAIRLGNITREMVYEMILPFTDKNKSVIEKLESKEKTVDFLLAEINNYIASMTQGNIGKKRISEAFQIMYTIKEFENMADIVSQTLDKRASKWINSKADFSDKGKEELRDYHKHIMNQLNRSMEVFKDMNLETAKMMKTRHKKHRQMAIKYEMYHYKRLKDQIPESKESSEAHLELITMMRNIASHATNIARIHLKQVSKNDKN